METCAAWCTSILTLRMKTAEQISLYVDINSVPCVGNIISKTRSFQMAKHVFLLNVHKQDVMQSCHTHISLSISKMNSKMEWTWEKSILRGTASSSQIKTRKSHGAQDQIVIKSLKEMNSQRFRWCNALVAKDFVSNVELKIICQLLVNK